ncbi:MAG: zinc-dependent metalloprotease [Candidatus Zixiibacteriota bacterium]
MSKRCLIFLVLLLGLFLVHSAGAQIHDHSAAAHKPGRTDQAPSKGNKDLKPFKELTKNKVVTEGLFTFYRDTTDNSLLMAIKPEQLGPYFLCNTAKSSADGSVADTGPLGRSIPFFLKRVGKNIQMIEKNLLFRADSASVMSGTLKKGISDHLVATLPIKSEPHDSSKAVLVDPDDLFIRDADNLGYYLGQQLRLGIGFDSENSSYETIKSFPQNSELDIRLHFKSNQELPGMTLQNGQSFFHVYHYSISSLPQTDYVPRLADDRVGYFMTMFQDYSTLDQETPYVRYIERWSLKKKNPDARISEPVEPIVFWIDNAVPVEFRDAIAEGVEFWNKSFEKIGFRNAIIAKQMPDTVDWDPLDARYSTIRWMVSPGRNYAIGPSRANPFTGQIYDADISISVDIVRTWFNLVDKFVKPVGPDGQMLEMPNDLPDLNEALPPNRRPLCTYGEEMSREAAFGLSYLLSTSGSFANKDSLTRIYVHSALTEWIAHEVGHTLGFMHNFKASSIYSLEQLRDPEFTRRNSTGGTIMDYNPPLISPKGTQQGEFFASTPGPYDDLLIEYGYSDFGSVTRDEERERLHAIASRAAAPELAFATDFDLNAYAVDPMVERHDMGNDPIAYCDHKINLTQELWRSAIEEFEKPGVSYEKLRMVFMNGWRSYSETARNIPHYIGGLYHSKAHVGDPGSKIPFTPVPAAEQRRAIQFLSDRIFAPDAFSVSPELLNKLQSNRFYDFSAEVFFSPIAFQWHEWVLSVQAATINNLYHPLTLQRLLNGVARVPENQPRYTMYDLFTDVRRAIWSEISTPSNVNSYRRQLQLNHLRRLIVIYLSSASVYPADALTLAANDLEILDRAALTASESSTIDAMSRAHFREVRRQIESARSARRNYVGF